MPRHHRPVRRASGGTRASVRRDAAYSPSTRSEAEKAANADLLVMGAFRFGKFTSGYSEGRPYERQSYAPASLYA